MKNWMVNCTCWNVLHWNPLMKNVKELSLLCYQMPKITDARPSPSMLHVCMEQFFHVRNGWSNNASKVVFYSLSNEETRPTAPWHCRHILFLLHTYDHSKFPSLLLASFPLRRAYQTVKSEKKKSRNEDLTEFFCHEYNFMLCEKKIIFRRQRNDKNTKDSKKREREIP